MAVTVRTEVKEEFVPLDVKVEMAEGDAALEFNQDANAALCIEGNHEWIKIRFYAQSFFAHFGRPGIETRNLRFIFLHVSIFIIKKNEKKYKKTRTSRSFKVSN